MQEKPVKAEHDVALAASLCEFCAKNSVD